MMMTAILVLLFAMPMCDFWLATDTDVYRIDSAGNTVTMIPMVGTVAMAVDGDGLWLGMAGVNDVFRFDSAGDRTCDFPTATPSAMAGDSGTCWTATTANEVMQYDCSGQRLGEISVGNNAADIEVADGLLWTAISNLAEINAYDLAGHCIVSVPTGQGVRRIEVLDGNLYVSWCDDTICVYSVSSGAMLADLSVIPHVDFCVTDDHLYVLRTGFPEIHVYDLAGVFIRVIDIPAVGNLIDVSTGKPPWAEQCASAPGVPYPSGCSYADLDHDGDVDQSDFAVWQAP